MARPKKKISDPALSMEALLTRAVEAYVEPYDDRDERESSLPSLRTVADQLNTTILRTRKLLITAEYFTTGTSRMVQEMAAEGRTIAEIMDATELSRASINSYLPYKNLAFNLDQTTVNADRHRVFRRRVKAVEELKTHAGLLDSIDQLFLIYSCDLLRQHQCAGREAFDLLFLDPGMGWQIQFLRLARHRKHSHYRRKRIIDIVAENQHRTSASLYAATSLEVKPCIPDFHPSGFRLFLHLFLHHLCRSPFNPCPVQHLPLPSKASFPCGRCPHAHNVADLLSQLRQLLIRKEVLAVVVDAQPHERLVKNLLLFAGKEGAHRLDVLSQIDKLIMSNMGLYKACDVIGIHTEKTAVGDKYVAENMMANGYPGRIAGIRRVV